MNWLPSINFSGFCYCWGPVEVRSLHFYPSESNYILISLTFRPVRNAIFIASDIIPFDWLPSSLSSWGPEMKLLALLKRLSVIIFTLHKVESKKMVWQHHYTYSKFTLDSLARSESTSDLCTKPGNCVSQSPPPTPPLVSKHVIPPLPSANRELLIFCCLIYSCLLNIPFLRQCFW